MRDDEYALRVRASCRLNWVDGNPTMSARDIRYVVAHYAPVVALSLAGGREPVVVRQLMGTALPEASYVLPDGTEMVPQDYFALIDAAGDPDAVRPMFVQRFITAAVAHRAIIDTRDADGAWQDYLTGLYGVCLWEVTPENIVRKGELIAQIEGCLARLDADVQVERDLRTAVDELDALERPFTGFDRRRFDRATSRDRYVTAVRRRLADGRRCA